MISHALTISNSRSIRTITHYLLKEKGIFVEELHSTENMLSFIEKKEYVYDLIIISHQCFRDNDRHIISRLRENEHYLSVPIILLSENEGNNSKRLYNLGFTQIFSLSNFDGLNAYIEQSQNRNTFEKSWNNKAVIIEDNLPQQNYVKLILEEQSFECFCYFSAEEALKDQEKIQPDIIVCDFFLKSKMTGLDMIIEINQEDHLWNKVPIIIMTALDDTARKYELIKSGANAYIKKPIDPIDLYMHVESLIRYKHLFDVVETQKSEMKKIAMRDQLTNLYNRHFVAEQVEINISEAIRHESHYSIVLLDIDFFKKINDNHGHDVGDRVLKEVGSFLKKCARNSDVVARMGGEEFLIIMNHCDLSCAKDKAENIRYKLEQLKPAGLKVTASFGAAQLTTELNTFSKLYKAADDAAYSAKENGRNCVAVAKP